MGAYLFVKGSTDHVGLVGGARNLDTEIHEGSLCLGILIDAIEKVPQCS